MEKLSFVIPCYRSEKTVSMVVKEITETMREHTDYSYEVILVDDASPDNVYSVIEQLCEEDKEHLKGIQFSKNFGQHAALMAGYRQTEGDIIISLDDDGQTPVFEVFNLIKELDKGYDVVYASYEKIKQSGFRILGSKVNKKMMEIMVGKPKNIDANSFFVAKRFIIDEVLRYDNSYPYLGGLIFRTTKNVGSVVVQQRERQDGTSGYSFKKLLSLWVNGFTAFSTKPLQVASIVGVVFAIIGFVMGIVTLVNKFVNPLVPMGYSTIVSLLLIIGGIIMLILGMIGEYIGRIYLSLNKSPQYVVKNEINCKK